MPAFFLLVHEMMMGRPSMDEEKEMPPISNTVLLSTRDPPWPPPMLGTVPTCHCCAQRSLPSLPFVDRYREKKGDPNNRLPAYYPVPTCLFFSFTSRFDLIKNREGRG